jgi:CheY-like chemotaxis protein
MRILVIDDSITSQSVLKSMLVDDGHEVLVAGNGQVGLEKIAQHKPELIILDLLMPDMDGFEVLSRLKKDASEIPVIVLTADIQDEVRKECMELGAKCFLTKPFSTVEVMEAVQSIREES